MIYLIIVIFGWLSVLIIIWLELKMIFDEILIFVKGNGKILGGDVGSMYYCSYFVKSRT